MRTMLRRGPALVIPTTMRAVVFRAPNEVAVDNVPTPQLEAGYALVPVAALHVLPDGVSFEEGAWTDNLGVALWSLERGRLAGGEHVVLIGSGAIGLCATQLARALGAGRVTLVGRGERLRRAKDLADEVVDSAEAARLTGTA